MILESSDKQSLCPVITKIHFEQNSSGESEFIFRWREQTINDNIGENDTISPFVKQQENEQPFGLQTAELGVALRNSFSY